QAGPGGINDLSRAEFQQDGRKVRVRGSAYVPDANYRIKLEAAQKLGYRSIVVVGIRDAVMIAQLDHVLDHARERAEERFGLAANRINLLFRNYGKNGVMGDLEPDVSHVPKEIGL